MAAVAASLAGRSGEPRQTTPVSKRQRGIGAGGFFFSAIAVYPDEPAFALSPMSTSGFVQKLTRASGRPVLFHAATFPSSANANHVSSNKSSVCAGAVARPHSKDSGKTASGVLPSTTPATNEENKDTTPNSAVHEYIMQVARVDGVYGPVV